MATYAAVNGHEEHNEKAPPAPAPAPGHPHQHNISDFMPGHHNHNGQQHPHHSRHFHLPRGIHEDGESGRRGFTPHFFKIVLRSSCVPSALCNILWPFVPIGIVFYVLKKYQCNHNLKFALFFLAMIPNANLLGFAGQELARKLPKVFGVILETFLGGIVEIILFIILLARSENGSGPEDWTQWYGLNQYGAGNPNAPHHKRADAGSEEECGEMHVNLIPVIQAAILGSVLANLLLCLGLCFVAGGVRHAAQKFSKEISETGSGLLLMAAFALTVPRAFGVSLENSGLDIHERKDNVLQISHAAGAILIIAYVIYVVFQMFSHHSIISEIFEEDELRDRDRHRDLAKDKLTMTECIISIIVSLALVSFFAYALVREIEPIVHNNGVSEMFMGLILVPLVEKFAEHLTAIDEAWDNTMNLALAHVLGATLQTVLFNTGLIVCIGWGIGKPMDLDFNTFHVIIVVLAILAVGSFLRDGESTYLEGSICVMIYILIAVAAFNYPNLTQAEIDGVSTHSAGSSATTASTASHAAATTAAAAGEAAHKAIKMMMRV